MAMPFDGTSKASVAAQSITVLGLLECFFEGGARWARRTYHAPDGKRCLLGAIDHIRCETGVTNDCAAEYLAGAINLRQLSKGLPPLGDRPTETVIGFNDAFARRYSEIADIMNAAKELAATDAHIG
jgi:hypothetical protein